MSTVARTQTTHHVAATLPTAAPPAAPEQRPASQSAVAPVVDLTAKPANNPAAASKPVKTTDETLPIAGGALALLALGGAAYAVSRRRRREAESVEETAIEHQPMSHDPIFDQEQPAITAPSAFAWSPKAPATEQTVRDGDDDRLPGETWVERAYRGPSAGNPSVSLKARLRRAAFFDKRERDVAAGIAQPVDRGAGLPQRELA